MIGNSFILLERIGQKQEQNIWRQGVLTWADFLRADKIAGISCKSKPYYDRQLAAAESELLSGNSSHFCRILKPKDMWRLFSYFGKDAVYLDIETTGVGNSAEVIMVGLFDGLRSKTMIKGINLDFSALKNELLRYKLILTFNGASFDLPFLEKRHPGTIPKIPHIDLMPLCAKVGLCGGLKMIEKELGISRNKITEHLYGGDVLRLWRMHRATGDDHYLNLLVEYNEDDCYNLRKIAGHVIGRLEDEMKQKISHKTGQDPDIRKKLKPSPHPEPDTKNNFIRGCTA